MSGPRGAPLTTAARVPHRYRIALEDIRGVLASTPTNDIANKAQHRIGRAVRQLKQAKNLD